jgi:hypothetical protein
MFCQCMLLYGKFSLKKERTSRVGYILDYDTSPLTEELLRCRVTLTTEDIHRLVDLGYCKAVQICKDLLHMPVPQLPLILAPLSGVNSKTKTPQHLAKTNADDEDSDAEIEKEEDTDDEDVELDTEHDTMDADTTAEAAALDTSHYARLCADFDATIAEARQQNNILLVRTRFDGGASAVEKMMTSSQHWTSMALFPSILCSICGSCISRAQALVPSEQLSSI